jgi:hypothetical protein
MTIRRKSSRSRTSALRSKAPVVRSRRGAQFPGEIGPLSGHGEQRRRTSPVRRRPRVRCTSSTASQISAVQSSARRVSCKVLNTGNTRAHYRCSWPCVSDETHAEPEDERHGEPALSFLMEANAPESMYEIAQVARLRKGWRASRACGATNLRGSPLTAQPREQVPKRPPRRINPTAGLVNH